MLGYIALKALIQEGAVNKVPVHTASVRQAPSVEDPSAQLLQRQARKRAPPTTPRTVTNLSLRTRETHAGIPSSGRE
jgi:hypothetical protein